MLDFFLYVPIRYIWFKHITSENNARRGLYPLESILTFLFVQENYGQAYQGLKNNKNEEVLLVKEA